MTIPYRQRIRLWRIRRGLFAVEPQLAAMLVTFNRLYAREKLPAREQVRHRLPRLVRALAGALWVVLCLARRALRGCGRLLLPFVRPLRSCCRPLRRAALHCLVTWSFLPAGFRLIVGAWLVEHRVPASVPSAEHRRHR